VARVVAAPTVDLARTGDPCVAVPRLIADYFRVAHLGYAAAPDLRPFGSDVFTR
jgi:hypothetical protein